jgi:hypothetical protein
MNKNQTADYHDTRVDVKVVLGGIWTTMLFVFAYVDIFGFWRADVINGALLKEVPDTGFEIDQPFLVVTTVYILIPSLMVIVSLLAPAKTNRTTNIISSLIYAVSVAWSLIGETWIYYILGSIVEVILLLAIARTAWTWPTRSATAPTAISTHHRSRGKPEPPWSVSGVPLGCSAVRRLRPAPRPARPLSWNCLVRPGGVDPQQLLVGAALHDARTASRVAQPLIRNRTPYRP